MKKILSILLVSALLFSSLILSSCDHTNNGDNISIVYMSGTTVEIPKSPKKIAAVSPSTGDLMIAFELGSLLDGTYYSTLNNP